MVENDKAVSTVEQEFTVYRSHVLAVVQSGTDATIQRAIETARGMGVGTMTAIVGGTPDNNALDAVNNGTVNWNGTDYTGLDLTGSGTDELKAAALTTLLSADAVPPVVAAIDGVYIAQYAWLPTATPAFGTGTVATDFGFGADAVVSPGPFIRTRTRALNVTLAGNEANRIPRRRVGPHTRRCDCRGNGLRRWAAGLGKRLFASGGINWRHARNGHYGTIWRRRC